MTRSMTTLAKDAAIAGLAGYVATRVMEPVSQKLYELESDQARKQEDAVRPGPPPEMAARKTAALFGIELSDQQLQRGTMAFDYGLAISWAPFYQVLRRKTELGPAPITAASARRLGGVLGQPLGLRPARDLRGFRGLRCRSPHRQVEFCDGAE